MPVVEEFLKVSDVKNKNDLIGQYLEREKLFLLTPGTRGFFSGVAGYSVSEGRSQEKKPVNA